MKTPKETSVLTAFQKPTAIWDIKMEDIPVRPQNNMFEKQQ